jgi:hypothetical protein
MTMEERRVSFAKLIAETADPKRKEALAQILEQIEKHPEPSPAERAWLEENGEWLEALAKRALESNRQRLQAERA